MKTTLYYFSGTGNSLKVAKELAVKIGDTELVSIASAKEPSIQCDCTRVGFVFPVYCWGMPRIVYQFIQRLAVNTHTYYFAVATAGSSVGSTFTCLNNELQKKGVELSLGYKVVMPGNYIPMYDAISEEKRGVVFKKADDRISMIAECVQGEKVEPLDKSFFLLSWLSRALYKLSISNFAKMDKHFWVDETCKSTGICEKVCPVGNIKMIEGKPRWQGNCEQCFACLQWCPYQAIQYKKSTVSRKRYHHPEIQVKEIIDSARALCNT